MEQEEDVAAGLARSCSLSVSIPARGRVEQPASSRSVSSAASAKSVSSAKCSSDRDWRGSALRALRPARRRPLRSPAASAPRPACAHLRNALRKSMRGSGRGATSSVASRLTSATRKLADADHGTQRRRASQQPMRQRCTGMREPGTVSSAPTARSRRRYERERQRAAGAAHADDQRRARSAAALLAAAAGRRRRGNSRRARDTGSSGDRVAARIGASSARLRDVASRRARLRARSARRRADSGRASRNPSRA